MKPVLPIPSILLSILFFFSCTTATDSDLDHQSFSIVPRPVGLKELPAKFQLEKSHTIYYTDPSLAFPAAYLRDQIKKITGFALDTTFLPTVDPLRKGLILDLSEDIPQDEGYELKIDKNIVIASKGSAGMLYGVQSLIQLILKSQSFDLTIPGMVVTDYPRFSWRGMHLDVSRHFFDKDFIKKYIDILFLHKMNTFHWHLVDDQGWRIEIKKYPKLTEVGAWRVDREHLPWNERPPQSPGEKATYGGFYTQDEIREIVEYARKRNIVIVPEIEMPAHVSSAIAAYPEFSCTANPITVPSGGVWPITDIYCAGNEETFRFLEDVLTEVMELFPSRFIHIGGDEADKTEWRKCKKCQRRMEAEGLKNERELQSYFISRIDRFLTEKGRRLIGWDEILEGGLAENAAVMSWRGEQGGIQAAKMNHDVIMTPVSHCYFDYYQSLDKDIEPIAFGGFTDLEKVYRYEPVPEQLPEAYSGHILGAQGNVWTEYMTDGNHVEYMALPRMTALSETLWTPKEHKDYENFQSRLSNHFALLSLYGINYFVPTPQNLLPEMIFVDSFQIALERPWPFGKIFYTTDGTEPSTKDLEFTQPVKVTENGIIKAVFVLENGKTSEVKSGKFTKTIPLKATEIADSEIEHGLFFAYYEGAVTSVKELDKLRLKGNGTVPGIELPEEISEDHFALTIDGLIDVPETGVYTFTLVSDDGSFLWIDEQPVVNADGLHGPEPASGQIALEQGFHTISVQYFEAGGGQTLEAYVEGPGLKRGLIPASMYYRKIIRQKGSYTNF